ncbi:MAG: ATPase domain-containing protein, partial [Halobacteriales archaeon]
MRNQGNDTPNGSRLTTGISGLDQILSGGFRSAQNALIRGPPGSGKTIFGLHFLAAGTANGQPGLFINLGEPETYIEDTADHFGLDGPELHFLNLSPSGDEFSESETYSLFESAEVEQPSLVGSIRSTVEEITPSRVLIDPITELRYLTTDEHQFRKQILSLLDYLRAQDISVLLTSQAAETMPDDDLQFLVDAVVNLELHPDRRTVNVSKFRGSGFQRGRHTYEISADGVAVYPNLTPGTSAEEFTGETLSSGVPELDEQLHGGIERGTVTIVSGPTGVGKTTTGTQFMKEAA